MPCSKSLAFLLLIFGGYICGITGKLLSPGYKWYVLFFYILNFIMVGADLVLYVRNYRLDQEREKNDNKEAGIRRGLLFPFIEWPPGRGLRPGLTAAGLPRRSSRPGSW